MSLTLIQASPFARTARGAASYGTGAQVDGDPMQTFIDIMAVGRWSIVDDDGANITDQFGFGRDPVTWMPAEIPSGFDRLNCLWAWARQDADQPVFGTYAIRHNLPGTYTLSVGGSAQNFTIVNPTRATFTLTYPVGNFWINIDGPAGPMPSGWFMEVLLTTDEARYDDTSLTFTRRIRRPEFMALIDRAKPSSLRWMTAQFINNDINIRDVADYPVDTAHSLNAQPIPLKHITEFSNEIGCDCWINIHAGARDPLIQYIAEYMRDNLRSDLKLYVEFANECWNNLFPEQTLRCSAAAYPLLETVGTGTVSSVKGSNILTISGGSFLDQIGPGSGITNTRITVGDYGYFVNLSSATATTVQINQAGLNRSDAIETVNNQPWAYATTGSGRNYEGYRILSTNMHTIFETAFAGQLDRLERVCGTQLANTGATSAILSNTWWQGEPGYRPSEDTYDVLACNLYFGVSFFQNQANKDEIKRLWDLPDAQGAYDHYADVMFDRCDAQYKIDRDHGDVVNQIKSQQPFADQYGLRIVNYEGGTHIIHGPVINLPDDQSILDSFEGFLSSAQATEVFEYWADMHIRYLGGPIEQFTFIGPWSEFGFWGMFPRYGYETDSRIEVILGFVNYGGWWLDTEPPRWAKIRDLDNANGVTIAGSGTLDLSDWASINTTSWSGTGPGGATPDANGIVTMPAGPIAAADYTFTATNAAGSTNVTVNIEVT